MIRRAKAAFEEGGQFSRVPVQAFWLVVLLWVLIGTIVYPALTTAFTSLTVNDGISIARYVEFFTSSLSLLVLRNSFVLGILTVVLCGVVGTGLAFLTHYFECPHRGVIEKLLLLPVMMPGIIIVFAFVQLYGESGLITKILELVLGLDKPLYSFSGLPGILFVHVYTQYVYFYLTVSLAIRQIDASVVESARMLGASNFKVFTSVIVPYIMPALITAAAVTFMTGIGSFTAPSIVGGSYKVLTTQILLSKANNYMGTAAVQVVVLTGVSIFFFLVLRWYERRRLFENSVKGVPFRPVKIRNIVLRRCAFGLLLALSLTILLPFMTIVVLSFVDSASWMVSIYPQRFTLENYGAFFFKARTFRPFLNSVNMSLLAACICLAVAIPSSWIIEKTRLRFRGVIDFLVMLPWAMPASAVAINIITENSTPSIFSFNMILVGTYILLPLGYFINSLPIVVKTTHISFQGLNSSLLEASKSLGASQVQTLRRVVLPMLSPGLLAGFLFVFVRSIGEYTISTFLYTASNKPISIAMVNAVFEYDIGLAMTYGSLLIALAACLSALISRVRPVV